MLTAPTVREVRSADDDSTPPEFWYCTKPGFVFLLATLALCCGILILFSLPWLAARGASSVWKMVRAGLQTWR